MTEYTVEITDDALTDMNDIYEYIAIHLQSPENALNQYNRIADKIIKLNSYPDRYRLFDSEPEHSLGIHKMIVDNYLVCYVIDPGIVTVLAVFYGASDVHQRLQERYQFG
ncbi:MAG: type II toxin-antitoxin system RelE/ParE family toxin [Flexilinea sp.]|nr:type II toxin-antitoxin system RelE/ParE family toxin [Flexilinea sp.]